MAMIFRTAVRQLRAPAMAAVVRRAAPTSPARLSTRLPSTQNPSHFSTSPGVLQSQQSRFTPPEPPKSKPDEESAHSSNEASSTESSENTRPNSTQPNEQVPLPDLTQGIPSTLEYETAGATNRTALASLPEAPAGGGYGKGELPASAYISSSEKRRQKYANYFFVGSVGFGLAITVYAGRDWDDEEEMKRHPDVPNGWGFGLWWNRASTRTKELLSYYHEPAFEKLLPDPDPVYGRPYTLVIGVEDFLIHTEWTREHGWRIAKRPGADYFIQYLSQYYELVFFTTTPYAMGEPLIKKLDPYRFVIFPLYREATKYKDGQILKDLSYLNRDLSKVIIMDCDPSYVRAQPENAIILPKWEGDAKDRELVNYIPFLEYVYTMQYGDVRQVLKSFDGKNIPLEFSRREAIARAEFIKQLESQRKKHPHQGEGGIASLGSLLGLKSSNMSLMVPPDGEPNVAEQFAQGKMLQDIARERGQKNYERMQQEIRENGAKWLKEDEELQEKMQQEAMASVKQSFSGWFVGGSPPQAPGDQPNQPPAGTDQKQ